MQTKIRVRSGALVDLLSLRPEDVVLRDVAFALARLARFTGHCGPYSVAQHSVWCADTARDRGYDRLEQANALFHDAHEAYCGDVSTPAKNALRELGADFGLLELPLERVVRRRFGLTLETTEKTKELDRAALAFEFENVWTGLVLPWAPTRASREFEACAERLGVR